MSQLGGPPSAGNLLSASPVQHPATVQQHPVSSSHDKNPSHPLPVLHLHAVAWPGDDQISGVDALDVSNAPPQALQHQVLPMAAPQVRDITAGSYPTFTAAGGYSTGNLPKESQQWHVEFASFNGRLPSTYQLNGAGSGRETSFEELLQQIRPVMSSGLADTTAFHGTLGPSVGGSSNFQANSTHMPQLTLQVPSEEQDMVGTPEAVHLPGSHSHSPDGLHANQPSPAAWMPPGLSPSRATPFGSAAAAAAAINDMLAVHLPHGMPPINRELFPTHLPAHDAAGLPQHVPRDAGQVVSADAHTTHIVYPDAILEQPAAASLMEVGSLQERALAAVRTQLEESSSMKSPFAMTSNLEDSPVAGKQDPAVAAAAAEAVQGGSPVKTPFGEPYSPGGTLRSPFYQLNPELSSSSMGSTIFGQVQLPGSPNMHVLGLTNSPFMSSPHQPAASSSKPTSSGKQMSNGTASPEPEGRMGTAYDSTPSRSNPEPSSVYASGPRNSTLDRPSGSSGLPGNPSMPARYGRSSSAINLTTFGRTNDNMAASLNLPQGLGVSRQPSMPGAGQPQVAMNLLQLISASTPQAGMMGQGNSLQPHQASAFSTLAQGQHSVSTTPQPKPLAARMSNSGLTPAKLTPLPLSSFTSFPTGVIQRATQGKQPVRFIALQGAIQKLVAVSGDCGLSVYSCRSIAELASAHPPRLTNNRRSMRSMRSRSSAGLTLQSSLSQGLEPYPSSGLGSLLSLNSSLPTNSGISRVGSVTGMELRVTPLLAGCSSTFKPGNDAARNLMAPLVSSLAVSSGAGAHLVWTGHVDGTLRVWDTRSAAPPVWTRRMGGACSITALCVADDAARGTLGEGHVVWMCDAVGRTAAVAWKGAQSDSGAVPAAAHPVTLMHGLNSVLPGSDGNSPTFSSLHPDDPNPYKRHKPKLTGWLQRLSCGLVDSPGSSSRIGGRVVSWSAKSPCPASSDMMLAKQGLVVVATHGQQLVLLQASLHALLHSADFSQYGSCTALSHMRWSGSGSSSAFSEGRWRRPSGVAHKPIPEAQAGTMHPTAALAQSMSRQRSTASPSLAWRLLTAHSSGTILLWDLSCGRADLVCSITSSGMGHISGLAVAQNLDAMVTTHKNGDMCIWPLPSAPMAPPRESCLEATLSQTLPVIWSTTKDKGQAARQDEAGERVVLMESTEIIPLDLVTASGSGGGGPLAPVADASKDLGSPGAAVPGRQASVEVPYPRSVPAWKVRTYCVQAHKSSITAFSLSGVCAVTASQAGGIKSWDLLALCQEAMAAGLMLVPSTGPVANHSPSVSWGGNYTAGPAQPTALMPATAHHAIPHSIPNASSQALAEVAGAQLQQLNRNASAHSLHNIAGIGFTDPLAFLGPAGHVLAPRPVGRVGNNPTPRTAPGTATAVTPKDERRDMTWQVMSPGEQAAAAAAGGMAGHKLGMIHPTGLPPRSRLGQGVDARGLRVSVPMDRSSTLDAFSMHTRTLSGSSRPGSTPPLQPGVGLDSSMWDAVVGRHSGGDGQGLSLPQIAVGSSRKASEEGAASGTGAGVTADEAAHEQVTYAPSLAPSVLPSSLVNTPVFNPANATEAASSMQPPVLNTPTQTDAPNQPFGSPGALPGDASPGAEAQAGSVSTAAGPDAPTSTTTTAGSVSVGISTAPAAGVGHELLGSALSPAAGRFVPPSPLMDPLTGQVPMPVPMTQPGGWGSAGPGLSTSRQGFSSSSLLPIPEDHQHGTEPQPGQAANGSGLDTSFAGGPSKAAQRDAQAEASSAFYMPGSTTPPLDLHHVPHFSGLASPPGMGLRPTVPDAYNQLNSVNSNGPPSLAFNLIGSQPSVASLMHSAHSGSMRSNNGSLRRRYSQGDTFPGFAAASQQSPTIPMPAYPPPLVSAAYPPPHMYPYAYGMPPPGFQMPWTAQAMMPYHHNMYGPMQSPLQSQASGSGRPGFMPGPWTDPGYLMYLQAAVMGMTGGMRSVETPSPPPGYPGVDQVETFGYLDTSQGERPAGTATPPDKWWGAGSGSSGSSPVSTPIAGQAGSHSSLNPHASQEEAHRTLSSQTDFGGMVYGGGAGAAYSMQALDMDNGRLGPSQGGEGVDRRQGSASMWPGGPGVTTTSVGVSTNSGRVPLWDLNPLNAYSDKFIKEEDIKLVEEVGRGAEGSVWRGRWHHIDVAVKEMHAMSSSFSRLASLARDIQTGTGTDTSANGQLEAVVKEVQTLIDVSQHPNIVRFIGVCVEPPRIVTEYYPLGSLFFMLGQARDGDSRVIRSLSWPRRLQMLHDVAAGMAYLHSRSYIHGDLRTPNIFVASDGHVKIGDFGFARLLGEREDKVNGKTTNPRWLAPEVLRTGKASRASDVFSFAIIMWEVLTWQVPYSDYISVQVTFNHVRDGFRPEIPADSDLPVSKHVNTAPYKALMCECWAQDNDSRPSFSEVASRLSALMHWQHNLAAARGRVRHKRGSSSSTASQPKPPPATTAQKPPETTARSIPNLDPAPAAPAAPPRMPSSPFQQPGAQVAQGPGSGHARDKDRDRSGLPQSLSAHEQGSADVSNQQPVVITTSSRGLPPGIGPGSGSGKDAVATALQQAKARSCASPRPPPLSLSARDNLGSGNTAVSPSVAVARSLHKRAMRMHEAAAAAVRAVDGGDGANTFDTYDSPREPPCGLATGLPPRFVSSRLGRIYDSRRSGLSRNSSLQDIEAAFVAPAMPALALTTSITPAATAWLSAAIGSLMVAASPRPGSSKEMSPARDAGGASKGAPDLMETAGNDPSKVLALAMAEVAAWNLSSPYAIAYALAPKVWDTPPSDPGRPANRSASGASHGSTPPSRTASGLPKLNALLSTSSTGRDSIHAQGTSGHSEWSPQDGPGGKSLPTPFAMVKARKTSMCSVDGPGSNNPVMKQASVVSPPTSRFPPEPTTLPTHMQQYTQPANKEQGSTPMKDSRPASNPGAAPVPVWPVSGAKQQAADASAAKVVAPAGDSAALQGAAEEGGGGADSMGLFDVSLTEQSPWAKPGGIMGLSELSCAALPDACLATEASNSSQVHTVSLGGGGRSSTGQSASTGGQYSSQLSCVTPVSSSGGVEPRNT